MAAAWGAKGQVRVRPWGAWPRGLVRSGGRVCGGQRGGAARPRPARRASTTRSSRTWSASPRATPSARARARTPRPASCAACSPCAAGPGTCRRVGEEWGCAYEGDRAGGRAERGLAGGEWGSIFGAKNACVIQIQTLRGDLRAAPARGGAS
jgi:hypothetical protein